MLERCRCKGDDDDDLAVALSDLNPVPIGHAYA